VLDSREVVAQSSLTAPERPGVWKNQRVIQTKREDHPTPAGGAYSVVTWDDETGNAEILEYDATDQLICRREWENFPGGPGADGVVGEVRTFGIDGQRVDSQPLRSRTAR